MSRIPPTQSNSTRQLADSLRGQLRRIEAKRPVHDKLPIRSGCDALDHMLPSHGFSRGSLVECLEATGGHLDKGVPASGINGASGAGLFALILARQAALDGGVVVIIDHQQHPQQQAFYPPAAACLGIDLEKMIVIRTDQQRDQLWALDQSLRCPAVDAVWAPLERLDPHDFRRLQLAAESGGGLGLLIRCSNMREHSSWSDIQLMFHPQVSRSPTTHANTHSNIDPGRRVRVEITRCRHGTSGGVLELAMNEITGEIQEVTSVPNLSTPVQVTKPAQVVARKWSG